MGRDNPKRQKPGFYRKDDRSDRPKGKNSPSFATWDHREEGTGEISLGETVKGSIYALLVGINGYPQKPLRGCLNDVRHLREYLQSRLGGNPGSSDSQQLHLETLTESEATRERIIERFRTHLGQAKKGDTALFFFAGHGSQERPPQGYEALEDDGWSETLMAYDSFDGYHLADKELAVLIAEVEQKGAHILVILDSCHSGSASRAAGGASGADGAESPDAGVRQVSPSEARRPMDSYWFTQEADLPAVLKTDAGWNILPYGPHVLLAACEDSQVAKECDSPQGERRGIFSYYLTELLQRLGPETSYQQLLSHLRASVRQIYGNQTPQAEGNLRLRFLGGLLPPRPRLFALERRGSSDWWLTAGRAYGIQAQTELRVIDPNDPDQEVARVRVREVGGMESSVDLIDGEMPCGRVAAEAEICWLPMPPTTVTVEGRGVDSSDLEDKLCESAYLRPIAKATVNSIQVLLSTTGCRIRRGDSRVDLIHLPAENSDGATVRALLEKISRWDCLSTLQNPHSPLARSVDLRFYRWRGPATGASSEPQLDLLDPDGELWLPYAESSGNGAQPPRITAELVNRSDRDLYFALVALDEDFGITAIRHGAGKVPPQANAWVRKLDGVQLAVPDRFHTRGISQRRDLLLLLLSDKPVDLTPLEQEAIRPEDPAGKRDQASDRAAPSTARAPGGLFESLLWRTSWREMDGPDLADEPWDIRVQPILTERPMSWQRIDGSGEALHPWAGLTLQPPRGCIGALRLHNRQAARHRDPALGNLPAKTTQRLRSMSLSTPTTGDPGLSVIEFRFDQFSQNEGQPQLILEVEGLLAEGEKLAAILRGDHGHELAVCQDSKTPTRCTIHLASAAAKSPGQRQRRFWIQLFAVG